VPDLVSLPSSFGQLEIATTGAEGVVMASNLAAARFVAGHLVVRTGAVLSALQNGPRFNFELGGTIDFGLVVETGGTFDSSFLASVSVVNNDGSCGSLIGLLRGPLSCLTVR
jgi:hypothetical protein